MCLAVEEQPELDQGGGQATNLLAQSMKHQMVFSDEDRRKFRCQEVKRLPFRQGTGLEHSLTEGMGERRLTGRYQVRAVFPADQIGRKIICCPDVIQNEKKVPLAEEQRQAILG